MKVKRSQFYIPFKKNTNQTGILEQMIKGAFVHQNASGIYTWLPLGIRSLEKLTNIIAKAHDESGIVKILMPMTQEAELWKKSKRFDEAGSEMLKMHDRKGKEFVFGPSAEEIITNMLASFELNKNTFPLNLYNIQWKFRDEIRPRFGVVRAREFLMKDAYSFHTNEECLMRTYKQMFELYSKIFNAIGLSVCTLNAETGFMGGFLSHEFLTESICGETRLVFDSWPTQPLQWETRDIAKEEKTQEKTYAEIGHIYALGDKYSKTFNLKDPKTNTPILMGCYGIGISRILGIMFEKPDLGCIAPFEKTLLTLHNTPECLELAQKIYEHYPDIIYDDLENSAGIKFAQADLIKSPIQIHIAQNEAKENNIIVKTTLDKKTIKLEQLFKEYK